MPGGRDGCSRSAPAMGRGEHMLKEIPPETIAAKIAHLLLWIHGQLLWAGQDARAEEVRLLYLTAQKNA